jgi:hypothetical protein
MRWKASVHADPTSPTQVIRTWCSEDGCDICNTAPPCKSPVEPLVGPQEVAIRDTARIVRNVDIGMDELQFDDDARRLPLLDGAQPLAEQLRKWHDHAFDQEQTVVYHIYELHEALNPAPDGGSVALDGKLIAIPVEPVWDSPKSVEPTGPTAAPTT